MLSKLQSSRTLTLNCGAAVGARLDQRADALIVITLAREPSFFALLMSASASISVQAH